MRKILRRLPVCALAGLAAPVWADDSSNQYTLEIERLPIVAALTEFSRQTGLQVGYLPRNQDEERTIVAPLKGQYTAESALQQLLAPSGLSFERVNERTVAVTTPRSAVARLALDSSAAKKSGFWRGLRLTQTETPSSTQLENQGSSEDSSPFRNKRVYLEEVIVTAQKRDERAFDVPISIVAMSANELQTRKVTSIDELSLAVPGLLVSSSGSYQRDIQLRGVGNIAGNLGSSMIGLYLDEASVTSGRFFQPDLRTYDLERVEVLRGPQGTLYGEGSVGGTIRFITKNPVLDRFGVNAQVAALFTEDGEPGQRVEGVVNVPVVETELGLRIAGTFERQGGWMDQPAAGRKDVNDQDLANVRIKGLWQPTSQFTANAMVVIHRNDGPPNIGEDDDGNFTQSFNFTTTPSNKDKYELYNLTLTYDFPAARLLSASSYLQQDRETRNIGFRFQITPPGTPQFHAYRPLDRTDSSIFTEEFRLTSIGSGPWQWTIGGFYRDAEFDDNKTAQYFGLPGPPGTPLPNPTSTRIGSLSKSWAAFGDTSYKLTDRFTLGAGLRYFEDEQEFTNVFNGVASPIRTGTFDSLNPRVYAQYKLTEQVNTYASAAKGFRSGGFNRLNRPAYGSESVWTYELGTKMFLADGRLNTDAAVFYTDYTDYQIFGLRPVGGTVVGIISNAGSARIRGIEWGVTWRPDDQWSLSFNGDYVDSEFYEINAASSSHAVGDPLDFAPKYAYTLSVQRDFRWSGRESFARLDYNKHGRSTYRNRGTGPWYFDESDIIDMLNLNVGLQWSDKLSLGLFAQNLLNDRGFLTPVSIETNAPRSRPRTVGIGFDVTF